MFNKNIRLYQKIHLDLEDDGPLWFLVSWYWGQIQLVTKSSMRISVNHIATRERHLELIFVGALEAVANNLGDSLEYDLKTKIFHHIEG